jgi:hypothetical protein
MQEPNPTRGKAPALARAALCLATLARTGADELLPGLAGLRPVPSPAIAAALPAYPWAEAVESSVLLAPPPGWAPTGLDSRAFLDRAERLWRDSHARGEIGADGRVLDPATGAELPGFRAVSSGALLLRQGRLGDLKETVLAGMDRCAAALPGLPGDGCFWVSELALAFPLLTPLVEAPRAARWRDGFQAIDTGRVYDPKQVHNWQIYAAQGEFLRAQHGLLGAASAAPQGLAYVDAVLERQLRHIDAQGMYRDPGCPITYDLATRLRWTLALAAGYAGPSAALLDECSRRGGLSTLLMADSRGLVPYGGRSDQYLFQEAMVAVLCAIEVHRHRATAPRLAGAFQRQARRSMQALDPWLRQSPARSLKNSWDPASPFGADPYRKHIPDLHFVAALLGLAAWCSDDAVAEAPVPAELAGSARDWGKDFHCILAQVPGAAVQFDTDADPLYGATGLGRIFLHGMPHGLLPAMPLPSQRRRYAGFAIDFPADQRQPPEPIACGPAWPDGSGGWISLAGLGARDGLEHAWELGQADAALLRCAICWSHGATRLREELELGAGGLHVHVKHESAAGSGLRYALPLRQDDGATSSGFALQPGSCTVTVPEGVLRVSYDPALRAELEPGPWANRNGRYRVLRLESGTAALAVRIDWLPR